MNELSLFTGCAGGELGTQHLLGWRSVGYVEINEYCQRLIAQRIRDGLLSEAPIFGDIRAFISEGYARSYQDMVDVITAGFPCQPFSVAGKQLGEHDERNLWKETLEAIRIIRPRFALLENVPGLLTHGYFGAILGDLSESGYDAVWKVISAAEVGAPHKRDRLWVLAYDTLSRNRKLSVQRRRSFKTDGNPDGVGKDVPDSKSFHARRLPIREGTAESGLEFDSKDVPDAQSKRLRRRDNGGCEAIRHMRWWLSEPSVGRLAHGVSCRVDRLKAIGNAQVPQVAAIAWRILREMTI